MHDKLTADESRPMKWSLSDEDKGHLSSRTHPPPFYPRCHRHVFKCPRLSFEHGVKCAALINDSLSCFLSGDNKLVLGKENKMSVSLSYMLWVSLSQTHLQFRAGLTSPVLVVWQILFTIRVISNSFKRLLPAASFSNCTGRDSAVLNPPEVTGDMKWFDRTRLSPQPLQHSSSSDRRCQGQVAEKVLNERTWLDSNVRPPLLYFM